MSQFLSNKYLRYREASAPRPIDDDHPCPRCDYNLRGLTVGGRCPECGSVITPPEAGSDVFTELPLRIVRGLSIGLMILAGSIVAIAAGPMLRIAGLMHVGWAGLLMIAILLMWTIGVWLVTRPLELPQAERHGWSRRSKLRIAARWLGLCWPAMIVLSVIAQWTTPYAARMLNIGSGILSLGALAGVIVLSLQLSRLAEWCGDDSTVRYFNRAVWGIGFAVVVGLVGIVLPPVRILACVVMFIWAASMFFYGLGIISMAHSATWAWRHVVERHQRDDRRRRRAMGERIDEDDDDDDEPDHRRRPHIVNCPPPPERPDIPLSND